MLLRGFVCLFFVVFLAQAQVGRFERGASTALGQGSAPPPASDCAASGTVVNALTGEPIPRAMVTINGGGNGAGSATDSSGRWSITNTACGMRMPSASRPGFINPNQVASSAVRQKPIELVSGTPVNNVKILLMPGAVMTGSVRDINGDPIESAQIRIMRINVQQGRRVMNNQGGSSTDLEGNYHIGNLTPGHYVICAESGQITYPVGGGDALVYRESCFPGPAAAGLTNSMTVGAGQEVRTPFTLTAQRGLSVRGTISGAPAPQTSPNGNSNGPLANIQLIANPGNNGKGGRVNRDGTFEITGVQPGSYILRANVNGGGGPQQGAQPSAQMPIEVGGSDVDNIVLAFQNPGSVEGFVRYALSQDAQGAGGNPQVNVNLSPAIPGTPFFGPIPQAKWDAAHVNFTFPDAPSGPFRLNANVIFGNQNGGNQNGVRLALPNGAVSFNSGAVGGGVVMGGSTAYVKSATLRGQDVLNQGFTVDGKVGPLEIVISDDVGAFDATVTDADSHPVAAAILLLSTSGQRRILNSGDDGHASGRNVPAGEYKAWAFDTINTVPYAEDDWMSRNAGPGETVKVSSSGSANIALKVKPAPAE